jgi:hypothetical protein
MIQNIKKRPNWVCGLSSLLLNGSRSYFTGYSVAVKWGEPDDYSSTQSYHQHYTMLMIRLGGAILQFPPHFRSAQIFRKSSSKLKILDLYYEAPNILRSHIN